MAQTATLDGMKYELSGTKKSSGKRVAVKAAEQLSTLGLLWIVVKRHKVGLLAIGNVVLVLNWVFPEWIELVKSLFQ